MSRSRFSGKPSWREFPRSLSSSVNEPRALMQSVSCRVEHVAGAGSGGKGRRVRVIGRDAEKSRPRAARDGIRVRPEQCMCTERARRISDTGWNEVIAGGANNQAPRRAEERARARGQACSRGVRKCDYLLANTICQYARAHAPCGMRAPVSHPRAISRVDTCIRASECARARARS